MSETTEAHPFSPPSTDVKDEGFKKYLSERFSLIPGEIPKHFYSYKDPVKGETAFIITNWALRIAYSSWTSICKDFTVPLKCIYLIEKKGGHRRPGAYGIDITACTTAHLFLPFPKKGDFRPKFFTTLVECWKDPVSLEQTIYESDHSWEEELKQMSNWELIDNTFCPTYPKKILVPPRISTETVLEVARFRSKGRLPFLSYIHGEFKTPLLRSAQPLTGITNSKSQADADYLSHINDQRNFQIYDCRPKINAFMNIFTGGGYESVDNYDKASFLFFNIPNIHRVRDCYIEMREGLDEGRKEPWKDWATLIDQIIVSGIKSVEALLSNRAVLVHCTDGWDRTAQISSITQVLIDGKARTIDGFRKVIQKEWCDAGHMFSYRCGHRPINKIDETAPIFIQFIDAMLQIMKQRPNIFEFNQKLPIFVAFHAYSQLYGDFMYPNCQKRDASERPHSLWDNLQKEEFLNAIKNPDYLPSEEPILKSEPYSFIEELHAPLIFGGSLNVPMF